MGWEGKRVQEVQRAQRDRAQAGSQLGNASKPDLKAHCKQSSHSCTMTCRSIEIITCLPRTYGYVCETSHGNL